MFLEHFSNADITERLQNAMRLYRAGQLVSADREARRIACQSPDTIQVYGQMAQWHGRGVPRDDGEAVKWYRLSAEQGDMNAQYTLAAFRNLGVERKVLIHINNTNPVLIEGSPESEAVAAAGWEVGYDGMEITL